MTGPRNRAKARALALNAVLKLASGLMGLMIAALIAQAALAEDEEIIRSHGYSYFGELSYPPDFPHLNYVNPDAPKGGEISIAVTGTFDTMNPYYRQGEPAALSSSMYEGLLAEMPMSGGGFPADVDGEYYGLLAHTIEYPKDSKDWVIFHMRSEARFSDGTPVTAHDVYFSHKLLLEQGLQSYARAVKERVPNAEVIDDHTIKFYFAEGFSRRSLIETVGFTSVWSKKWYEETGAQLNESRFEVSPGSGPYVIGEVVRNRRVIYERNPDYWGADLPINKGRYNFDRVRLEYFTDSTAAFEAFKAGDVTFRTESEPKQWATGYNFPALSRGDVLREELRNGNPPPMTGIVFIIEVNSAVLARTLGMPKGRMLLSRVLDDGVLPHSSACRVLPKALRVILSTAVPAGAPPRGEDRLVRSLAGLVQTPQPSLAPEDLIDCLVEFGAVYQSELKSKGTSPGDTVRNMLGTAGGQRARMELLHAILSRGGMVCGGSGPDVAAAWKAKEAEFMTILSAMNS